MTTDKEPLNTDLRPCLTSLNDQRGDDSQLFGTAPSPTRRLNRIGPREGKYVAASGPCIGQRLVRSRLELQMTQAEVAAEVSFQFKSGKRKDVELPLSRNAYCMYELGKVEPSLRTIVGLAHVLKVSPDWLAFGIGKKPNRLRSKAPVEADIAGARETRGAEQLETELGDQH